MRYVTLEPAGETVESGARQINETKCARRGNLRARPCNRLRLRQALSSASAWCRSLPISSRAFTAFGNKSDEIDVTSWGLDATYAEQLGRIAAELLSAQYIVAPYSTDDFSKINQTSRRGAPDWSAIEAVVKTYCGANGLDALLVISKDRGMIPNTTINRVPMGIQGGSNGAYLRLSAAISVYDCATGHMRETELLRFMPGHLFWAVPQVEISRDLITHPLSEMDDKTRDEMKSKLLSLPGPDWDQTLRRMVRTR
jgi:hypothetical protein